MSRDSQRQPEQLREFNFTVKGDEPLASKPAAVRLYQSDDDVLRPLGKDMAVFIREAVRERLQRRAARHANTGPSSTYD